MHISAMSDELSKQVARSGWTHQALAEEIGVHYTTIGRAIRKPSRRELIRARIAELIQQAPPPHPTQEGAGADG